MCNIFIHDLTFQPTLSALVLALISLSSALPHPQDLLQPRNPEARIQEVEDPLLKAEIFRDFRNQGRPRSVLYESLFPALAGLEEGQVVAEIEVEVESNPLVLRKAADPDQKLRERAREGDGIVVR